MIWYDMIKKGWKFESNRIANRNTDRKKREREIGSDRIGLQTNTNSWNEQIGLDSNLAFGRGMLDKLKLWFSITNNNNKIHKLNMIDWPL